jgi:predicted branched-subunit amino acid permease
MAGETRTSDAQLAGQLRYTRRGVADGLREGIPLALSVLPWGLAYGVAAQAVLTTLQGLAMSGYVYSATAQFVALEMWRHPLGVPSLLFAVFAINARYLLQGLTLAPWVMPLPAWQRWGTLFFLSDASWAASLRRFESGHDDVGHLLGTCVAVYAAWFASTWLGLLLPVRSVDPKTWGLDFAVTAAIVALAGARWSGRNSVLPWCVAAIAALISERLLGGNWFMFVGGIAGALAGAYRDERPDDY